VHVHEFNRMQLEEYLAQDERIVLPLASTEQLGYLSLGTDAVLAERVSVEAAELVGDGSCGGRYRRSDDEMQRIWDAGVAEVGELLESGRR
jgi:creatinine amidohydrolase